jgi:hypothetical protein
LPVRQEAAQALFTVLASARQLLKKPPLKKCIANATNTKKENLFFVVRF